MTNATNNAPAFRGSSVVATSRTEAGITIWVREARKNADGTFSTVRVLPEIALAWTSLSDAVRAEGFGYGMEVRLTRAAAIERDAKTGKSATAEAKHAAIRELVEHYASGTDAWAMVSAGGGGLSAETRDLINALVRLLGIDADTAEEQVREMSKADRDALRVDAEVKPILDEILAERARAAGAVNTQSLKDRLKGLTAKA